MLGARRRPTATVPVLYSLLQSRGPRGPSTPQFQYSQPTRAAVDHTLCQATTSASPCRRAGPTARPQPAEPPATAEPRTLPRRNPASWRRAQHRRTEGHEHPEAHPDRQGPQRRRRDRDAQAGADLPDPEGADRAERVHLLGGRARSAARRVRVPPRARLQLPARPRRHLRVAVADPQVRPADRRHGLRPDPAAEGRGAVLRPHQGRGRQLRAAGAGARQAVLREPDAALPAGDVQARDAARQPVGPRHGPDDADRQGAARPDRRAAAHRQDDAAPEHRAVGRRSTTPRST